MRWGILVNLAVIFAVSGILLFIVFGASLERAAVDDATEQAIVQMDLLQGHIVESTSPAEIAQRVWRLCRARVGLRPLVYDYGGKVLWGCPLEIKHEKPDPRDFGQRIHIEGGWFPLSLLTGTVVMVDVTGRFPHGIRTVRGLLEVPRTGFFTSWKFFAAYLLLTQAALFFLGYVLFHRTVIGPIRDVAQLAGRASGLTELQDLSDSGRFKEDIQKISAGLRAMITRIVEDREKMEALVERLSKINQDLEVAQQGLIRSEKMAGVGRLAAGLAHEVGNPLQIVMGYVELLERGPDSQSQKEIISRMDEELKRIHDILRKLLEFARPMRESMQECDINKLMADCTSLLRGRKGFRHMEFEEVLDPRLAPIETEPEKLRQILVNLLFNSVDALPETGGKIILRTRKHTDGLEIQVQDNGAGIAGQDLDKVFDPFFTTKEPGKGTGLGLAVCLGLVESLGGSIDIASRQGHGTLVTIRLPCGRGALTERLMESDQDHS